MTVYEIIAPLFGLWALVVAFIGIKQYDFPGKTAAPVIAISTLLFVATLSAAIVGGIHEDHVKSNAAASAQNN